MAPPRNMKHLRVSQQKNASARLKAMRDIYGAIQSHQHTTLCTSPINITQNIYQSPSQIPTPLLEQFYKYIPPPTLYNNNATPTHQPPNIPLYASNIPPQHHPSNTNTAPLHRPPNTNNPSLTPHPLNTTKPSPTFRDYSNWKSTKTKSVGIKPKKTTTSKDVVLDRSPITIDCNLQKKAQILLPSRITKKITKTTVSPAPLPVPRYDIPGEVEMTVAINTINTPVTTCAAKALGRKRKERENEQEKRGVNKETRTIILSEDYNLELHCSSDL